MRVRFSNLKLMAKSAKHYRCAVDAPRADSTRAAKVGSAVHALVLGQNLAHPIIRFNGDARRGAAWTIFEKEANPNADILTTPEWEDAERIAESIKRDPVARSRLHGARYETPLEWEEAGLLCVTSGVDIITTTGAIGDLKTTTSTEPDAWMRQAFQMHYPMQVAFYRRGALACGIEVSKELFLLGVETKPPYDVVDLTLTDAMIEHTERTLTLWLGKLKVCIESNQWPGYAQSSMMFDVPAWLGGGGDEEEDA